MAIGNVLQPAVPLQVEGKKWGVRAGAYIIDSIIFYLATLAISFITALIFGLILAIMQVNFPAVPSTTSIAEYAVSFVAMTAYFIIFEAIFGATPGKLFLGMRVVMDDGRPCSFGAAIVRGLLRYIDGLFFAIPAAVVMKAPLNKRIGDNSAHTMVVSSKSTFIQTPRPTWMFFIAALIYLVLHTLLVLVLLLSYL